VLLKGSKNADLQDIKGRNKALEKTSLKDSLVSMTNSMIRCSSDTKINNVKMVSLKSNSHIKKVAILSNKFENMFQINQLDMIKKNKNSNKFNKLYNAFNGI